jgi:geranylgeranyl diphosphate synthase type I
MAFSTTIQSTLLRHQKDIYDALRHAVLEAAHTSGLAVLQPFYGQMQYHLGWVDTQFTPIKNDPGKLLRPTLLLLSYEAAGAWGQATKITETTNDAEYLRRALPAAAALELTHNFTLVHDDIEDYDTERRHRPTMWNVWGIPQAINTGDGMFSLARLTLWGVLDAGVEGDVAARLGASLDHACLILAEGQYLDISFEQQTDISVASYVDMISRKTGALMRCATEMGAMLGTRDQETIERLRSFGWVIGIAFQVRDDLLGVWASTTESGKTPAGDIYRRKKSLPILHALEHANPTDQKRLQSIYQGKASPTQEQVEEVVAIFERTNSRAYCKAFLERQCQLAYEALAHVPRNNSPISARALDDMQTLVSFVEEGAKE